jgi:hypothetical protein
MNPTQPTEKVYLNPVNKMIDGIMDNFDWEETQRVMEFMNWGWAGGRVPTIERMKQTAERLLRNAAELRLNEYKDSHWEQGIISGTGGFEAQAFCNETKTEITSLSLQFILNQWNESIDGE